MPKAIVELPVMYSLDVFDTCISRTYGEPDDLLLDLAKRVCEELHEEYPDKEVLYIQSLRKKAERIARSKSTLEDIGLDDIYVEFEKLALGKLPVDRIKILEVALEESSVFPVYPILKRFQSWVNNGHTVTFVSDMYLPSNVIFSLLQKSGYAAEEMDLFVSGELGKTKRSGNLFSHLINIGVLSPGKSLHLGDNPLSDIKKAGQYGILTEQVPYVTDCNRYELMFLGRATNTAKISFYMQRLSRHYRRFYKEPFSDVGIHKRLAISTLNGISRKLVLSRDNSNLPLSTISAYVAAPLLNVFVFWMLEKARDENIDRLYFVARNGYVLYQIALRICEFRGLPIKCIYIYGSRSAWYPGSFHRFDRVAIDFILKKYTEKSVCQVLEKLNFSDDVIEKVIVFLTDSGFDVANSKCLYGLLESEWVECFERHFARERALVKQYLQGEEFFNAGKVGVVDIGWHLSSHNALYSIIDGEDNSGFVGFYFGVGRRSPPTSPKAPYRAFVSDFDSKRYSWMFKLGSMTLLEDVFTYADHGTTLKYREVDGSVTPVLKNVKGEENTPQNFIQNRVLDYTDEILLADRSLDFSLAKKEVLDIYERFYKFPLREEVAAISNLTINATTGHEDGDNRVLAHPVGMLEFVKTNTLAIFRRKAIKPKWTWYQGSLSISSPVISKAGWVLSRLESMLLKLKP